MHSSPGLGGGTWHCPHPPRLPQELTSRARQSKGGRTAWTQVGKPLSYLHGAYDRMLVWSEAFTAGLSLGPSASEPGSAKGTTNRSSMAVGTVETLVQLPCIIPASAGTSLPFLCSVPAQTLSALKQPPDCQEAHLSCASLASPPS